MACFMPDSFSLAPLMLYPDSREIFPQTMTREVLDKSVDFMTRVAPPTGEVRIDFRPGEPLMAEQDFFEYTLPLLRERFGRRLRLGMRSNLWHLSPRMIQLIREFSMAVRTGIENDSDMSDMQRGKGYYEQTSRAVFELERNGVEVRRECLFTRGFSGEGRRTFGYFTLPEYVAPSYDICCLTPSFDYPKNPFSLRPDLAAGVLLDTLEAYKGHMAYRRVGTLDDMAAGVHERKGRGCTFTECLGRHAAIACDGQIYCCHRFCGEGQHALGHVMDEPGRNIEANRTFQALCEKRQEMQKACGDCRHYPYCNNGCLYNAMVAGAEADPYCRTYRMVFGKLEKALEDEKYELAAGRITTRQAPVMAMAGAIPHPYDQALWRIAVQSALRHAEPGRGGYPYEDRQQADPLKTRHSCYVQTRRCGTEMEAEQAVDLVRQAVELSFESVVVTGETPDHHDLARMLSGLQSLERKGTRLILDVMDPGNLKVPGEVCTVFDAVMVNVDARFRPANEGYHKLRCLVARASRAGCLDKLHVYASLYPDDTPEMARDAKTLLGCLGILHAHTRTTPPVGRETGLLCTSEPRAEEEIPAGLFHPRFSCGLGEHIFFAADGRAYPCPALYGEKHLIGCAQDGLAAILDTPGYRTYRRNGVETNHKCRTCGVRYLCGGMCRAWVKGTNGPDSGAFACAARKKRYRDEAEKAPGRKL